MDLLEELRNIISDEDRVSVDGEELERHGRVFSYHAPRSPDAVVFPKNEAEVVEILRFANRNGVPVVPYGEGSSLEGNALPLRGGISLDLSLMGEILEVRPDDFIARVEPGVTHGKLNERLGEHGLHFPVDPGWDATLGGMAATNASGTNAVRYGAMRDQVLGLKVVLADGTAMRTGGMAMKSSAGYDLTRLFVGSEGTLGVFVELVLRLYPIPQSAVAARATFPDVETAGRAAVAMVRSGMQIGRVELVDARTVEAFNAYKGTEYAVSSTLFLEFSGTEAAIERDVTAAREISESEGCEAFEFEVDRRVRPDLRAARGASGGAQDHRGLRPRRSHPGTRRRRQLPRRLPGGPHRRVGARDGREGQRRNSWLRSRAWRHMHRGARDRLRQDGASRERARRLFVLYAQDKGVGRPQRDHEPRQDLFGGGTTNPRDHLLGRLERSYLLETAHRARPGSGVTRLLCPGR
jgi:D-lactate dehydrogenase (cytochrome)